MKGTIQYNHILRKVLIWFLMNILLKEWQQIVLFDWRFQIQNILIMTAINGSPRKN